MRASRALAIVGGVVLATTLGVGYTSAQQAPSTPAKAGADEAPVPVHQEPRHHLVFENDAIRVLDIQIPPGDTTLYHTHSTPISYVPISSSTTRSQTLGAEWSGGDTAARPPRETPPGPGRVSSNTNYLEKPYTHRVNNVGTTQFRLIGVINRSKGATTEADDISGTPGKPEVLNQYYRVFRVSLPPGQSTSSRKHASPVVVVQQTAGKIAVAGSAKADLAAVGAFAVHDGSGTLEVKNVGDTTVDVIELEVRGAQMPAGK